MEPSLVMELSLVREPLVTVGCSSIAPLSSTVELLVPFTIGSTTMSDEASGTLSGSISNEGGCDEVEG